MGQLNSRQANVDCSDNIISLLPLRGIVITCDILDGWFVALTVISEAVQVRFS